ncbi:MAG TPA: FecR domain-containing protein, partial [Spirochaetales bacterium]|nr:FecR domain-containing protein [Spirochaetales bacterium]
MRKLLLSFIVLLSLAVWAQPVNQTLVLEFVDGTEFSVTNPEGAQFFYAKGGILEGDTIPIGSIVSTGLSTQAVLKLKPNGTVIKLAKNTTFKIDLLATSSGGKNSFTLVLGKVRTIAAKGSNYEIKTTSTVCGVRGTDFIFSYEEGKKALLMVAEGTVEFTGIETGKSILVEKGQFADFYASFAPQLFNEQMFNEEYGDMGVPVSTLPPGTQPEEKKPEQPAQTAQTQPAPEPVKPETQTNPEEPTKPAEPAPENPFITWLKDVLGMELGSITINDQTWSKVVVQPTITLGKLKTALYLPIIYDKNLFDPQDWYHPNGQDEWSFGFDVGWQEHPWEAFLDALTDLSLKIKYIEYGSQLDDPFFLKIGNLRSFTIGHGLIMRNYANDSDFPAVRKIGFNIGIKGEQVGFEFLTNELTNPEILGTRLYFMPIKGSPFALGASVVADLAPARVFNTTTNPAAANDYGNPIFMGLGADIDFPIIPQGPFGLRFFTDVAAMMPYVRNDFTWEGNPVTAGFKTELLFDASGVKNWGLAS